VQSSASLSLGTSFLKEAHEIWTVEEFDAREGRLRAAYSANQI